MKRQDKAAGLAIWATMICIVAACGSEPTVGQSGSEGVPTGDRAPTVADVSGDSFRIVDLGVRACDDERDLTTENVVPAAAALRAQLGGNAAEFIVLMKQEVSLSDFPLPPSSRDDSATASAQNARALEIARLQACALTEVSNEGGTYLSSFQLINAFGAELSADAAIRLSQRADVRSVELSQMGIPPP